MKAPLAKVHLKTWHLLGSGACMKPSFESVGRVSHKILEERQKEGKAQCICKIVKVENFISISWFMPFQSSCDIINFTYLFILNLFLGHKHTMKLNKYQVLKVEKTRTWLFYSHKVKWCLGGLWAIQVFGWLTKCLRLFNTSRTATQVTTVYLLSVQKASHSLDAHTLWRSHYAASRYDGPSSLTASTCFTKVSWHETGDDCWLLLTS